MIDCGEGSQQMMRRMGLKFSRLSKIFISHLHGDHCLGLPGLLSTMALHGLDREVEVYMPSQGMEMMRSFVNYFCKDKSSNLDIRFTPVAPEGGLVYEDHALTVTAIPLYHRVPAVGYLFREKPKERHLRGDMADFYRIPIARRAEVKGGADFLTPDGKLVPNSLLTEPPEPSMSYAYCSDTLFDERVAEAVRGVDTLYHEATYGDDNRAKASERGHSTARQAGMIARLAGVRQLIIGHYSKRYTDISVLADEARSEFDVVIPAEEGLRIDLL